MECIGTEANGGLATYGEYGCDYDTARDFVVAQAFLMNDLKKFTEAVGYSPKNPRGMRTYEDMLQDFSEWWDEPDGEWWYDLAMFYFDGHEITDKEREAL